MVSFLLETSILKGFLVFFCSLGISSEMDVGTCVVGVVLGFGVRAGAVNLTAAPLMSE